MPRGPRTKWNRRHRQQIFERPRAAPGSSIDSVQNVSEKMYFECNSQIGKLDAELQRLESSSEKLSFTRAHRLLGGLKLTLSEFRSNVDRAHSNTVSQMVIEFGKQPKINMHWLQLGGLVTSPHQREVAAQAALVQAEAAANKGLQ